jgi:hypothetical protein
MAENSLVTRLKSRFPQGIVATNLEAMDPWIEVRPEQ